MQLAYEQISNQKLDHEKADNKKTDHEQIGNKTVNKKVSDHTTSTISKLDKKHESHAAGLQKHQ